MLKIFILSLFLAQCCAGFETFGHPHWSSAAFTGKPADTVTHSLRELTAAADNCPYHPMPVPLTSQALQTVSNAYAEFEKTLQGALNPTSTPGLSAQLYYLGEEMFSSTLGYANKATKTPPTTNTIFRIGSISKVFAVVMLYQLVDQGVLVLDDPVVKLVPDFQVINPFDKSKITWRQLASQMSGLQREMPFPATTTAQVRVLLLPALPAPQPTAATFIPCLPGVGAAGWHPTDSAPWHSAQLQQFGIWLNWSFVGRKSVEHGL